MWQARARAELDRREARRAHLQARRAAERASLTAELGTALDALDRVGDAVETLAERIAVGFGGSLSQNYADRHPLRRPVTSRNGQRGSAP